MSKDDETGPISAANAKRLTLQEATVGSLLSWGNKHIKDGDGYHMNRSWALLCLYRVAREVFESGPFTMAELCRAWNDDERGLRYLRKYLVTEDTEFLLPPTLYPLISSRAEPIVRRLLLCGLFYALGNPYPTAGQPITLRPYVFMAADPEQLGARLAEAAPLALVTPSDGKIEWKNRGRILPANPLKTVVPPVSSMFQHELVNEWGEESLPEAEVERLEDEESPTRHAHERKTEEPSVPKVRRLTE